MYIYKYKAIANNNSVTGYIYADNKLHVFNRLCAKKYHPLCIKQMQIPNKQASAEDLLLFFTHLNFQLKCGEALHRAIETFLENNFECKINMTVFQIINELKNGASIENAFDKCSAVFGSVVTSLLKSAGYNGSIAQTIENILLFLNLEKEWVYSVKRVIGYPILLSVFSILILCFSVFILSPQIISLLQEYGTDEIPFLTNILIKICSCDVGYFICILCMLFTIIAFFFRRKFYESLFYIPIIKKVLLQIKLWNFFKIIHISLKTKITFIEGFNLALNNVDLFFLKQELLLIRDNILIGNNISESFNKFSYLSSDLLSLIYISEEGNNLSHGFKHISEILYRKSITDIKKFGRSLSISLTVFTGFVFIIILYGLFYPIYDYIEVVGNY